MAAPVAHRPSLSFPPISMQSQVVEVHMNTSTNKTMGMMSTNSSTENLLVSTLSLHLKVI